jgi:hypothetical protein
MGEGGVKMAVAPACSKAASAPSATAEDSSSTGSVLQRATSDFPLLRRASGSGSNQQGLEGARDEHADADAAASLASTSGTEEEEVEERGDLGRGSWAATTSSTSSSTASNPPRQAPASSSAPAPGGLRTTHLTAAALDALPLDVPGGLAHALGVIEDLATEDRLLQAAALWARVRAFLAGKDGQEAASEEVAEARAYVAEPARAEWLVRLEERAGEAHVAMADLEDVSFLSFCLWLDSRSRS